MLHPQFAPDRASPCSRAGWRPPFNHHSGTSYRVAGVARYAPTEDHSVDNARRSRKGVACSAPTDAPTTEFQSLLWAEAKRGIVGDIYKPLVQLVLTIGRARTFDTYLPPPFLGVFDAEKIVFLPYKEIMPFFALNDFNWNVTPSDDSTREFGLLYEAIRASLEALRQRIVSKVYAYGFLIA